MGIGKLGENFHGQQYQLAVIQICADQRQELIHQRQQILPLDIAVAAHKGIHDLSLAAGTAEIAVGIQLSDPGVGQGLFTVQRLDTGCEAAAGFLVDFGVSSILFISQSLLSGFVSLSFVPFFNE